MPLQRQVYLLDPKKLSPETIAVTFAKTSRSPQSFREIAAELSDEKSAEFNEKWVVGYGHSSVAEHAVLHIAVENLSRLAVENLESNRLASYTEKSTRYQKWNPEAYFIPEELKGHLLLQTYEESIRLLLKTYAEIQPAVKNAAEAQFVRSAEESEAAWERRIRSVVTDVCRYLLPAASLANVGVTINARALEYALQKMLSSPLLEVQTLGEEIKAATMQSVPTLIKYADAVPYMQTLRSKFVDSFSPQPDQEWCRLVDWDRQAETRMLAAAIYQSNPNIGYAQAMELVTCTDPRRCQELAANLLAERGRFDRPPRETEFSSYTFDLTVDQGAYFEIKRHRMMTQIPQPLTANLGYAVPRLITAAGVEEPYHQAMQAARAAYRALAAWNPDVAAYAVPNGFNRRVLLSLNWRSADHFIHLRSSANAHFSVRRVAQRMCAQIRHAQPIFGQYLRVNPDETWQRVEHDYFSATAVME